MPRADDPYAGKKVAVVGFVNRSLARYRFLGDSAPDYMAEFLLDAGFRAVEGKGAQLDSVLRELEYNRSGYVDPSSAAQLGQHLGTDLIFVGSVTDYEQVKTKGGGGFNVMGWGLKSGGGKLTYNIQIAGRLVDIRTREILASKTTSYKKTFEVGGGGIRTPWGGGDMDQEVEVSDQTGGKILQKCVNQLIVEIVDQLNARG